MGPLCICYRSLFLVASIFSFEKTPCFRKIYPSYLIAIIAIIDIIVGTANIVIIVITAIIVKTANIVITAITAISLITAIAATSRKLALSSPGRTGLIPPAGLSDVAGNTGLKHRKPGGDYQTPHKPQGFPILTLCDPRGIRRDSAQPAAARLHFQRHIIRRSRRRSVCAACRLSDVEYSQLTA